MQIQIRKNIYNIITLKDNVYNNAVQFYNYNTLNK